MKKKNSLIGHNRPPRKHNYPKFRIDWFTIFCLLLRTLADTG